jgi:hypothetical protein
MDAEPAHVVGKNQRAFNSDTEYLDNKRAKVTDAVVQTGLPAHSTDPFRYLPLEILMEIVRYLHPQDYCVLQLMRTSKTWRVTLTTRREAEWEKKCKAMGAKMKSRGCSTWLSSWMKLMHARCLSCHEKTSSKNSILFGSICHAVPSWAIICHECQQHSPPYRVTKLSVSGYGERIEGLSPSDLATLPSLPGPKYYSTTHRIYWQPALDAKLAEVKAEAQRKKEETKRKLELLITSFGGDSEQLRAVIDSRDEISSKRSDRLQKLLTESVDDKASISQELGQQIVELNASIQYVLTNLPILHATDRARWSLPFDQHKLGVHPSISLKEKLVKVLQGNDWLDSLCMKELTQEEFLDATCVFYPDSTKCGPGGSPSKICTNAPAKDCTQARCGRCCTGPCSRHGR